MKQAQCYYVLCGALEAAQRTVCEICLLINTEMLDGCMISDAKLQIVTVTLHPDGVLTPSVVLNVVVVFD